MQEIFNNLQTDPEVPVRSALRDITVMFADESKETIAVFKHIVHRLGWNGVYVNSAVGLIDAVNDMLAKEQTLDAIIADINYFTGPRLTGITAAREVRKAMPNVPIVFLSAYVTSIIREEVRRVNAEVFQKPFDPEVLFTRLSQLIYWNRLAMAKEFKGDNRRRNSVNRTDNFRRATDYILSTPARIRDTLLEIGSKNI